MLSKISCPIMCLLLSLLLSGCGAGKSSVMIKEGEAKNIRLIAVLPVHNETSDMQAPVMLRDKVLTALHFKGYSQISVSVNEEIMKAGCREDKAEYSKLLGAQNHVDAVLYCDLKESQSVRYLFYSPISVAAVFELRSAKTGRLLWHNSYSTIRRNYGVSKNSLRLKNSQDYEPAIQELVEKAMKSLPESPDMLG